MSLTAHGIGTVPNFNTPAFRMWRNGSNTTTSTQDWFRQTFSPAERERFYRGEIDIEKESLTAK